jgi:predicted ATP-dependent serine protease
MTSSFEEACRQADAERSSAPPRDRLVYERVADVPAVPVDWVWASRIARRKLTLIAGDPGVGKSQITCDITARISYGSEWPDFGTAPSGSTIILSAEDSVGDTLRPRLEAAGADLKRVHVLKAAVAAGGRLRSFSLQSDLALLGEKVTELGDVVAIVVDPITSYMGKIDSHRTTDVRGVLEPLADFADRHDVSVLAVTHPPKATQAKALHAITGSLAFVAAARLVFIAVEESETERRLLLAVKNNLGAMAQGLGFSLAPVDIGDGISTSRVVWDSAPVTMSANQALWAAAEDSKNHAARDEAKQFLTEALSAGAVPAKDIERDAKKAGISARTLRRAREDLEVVVSKDGYQGEWQWRLP